MSEQEFLEALPWYVNGTLDDAGRGAVERHLREYPGAMEALHKHQALHAAVREEAVWMPADLGWDAFARRAGLVVEAPVADGRGRASRLARVLAWFVAPVRPPLVHGLLMAVVLCQAVALAVLWPGRDAGPAGYATERAAGQTAASAPLLQVRFKPDASEAEIRKLLLLVDGRLVGGPSQLGDYLVSVPAEQIEPARQALAASPRVEAVSVRDR